MTVVFPDQSFSTPDSTSPTGDVSSGSGPRYLLATPTAAEQQALVAVKHHVGAGFNLPFLPTALVDMRPAGVDEIWAFGWRQRLLKYDLQLNLKSVIDTYGTPRPNNNHMFPWDAHIDFSAGLVFCPCYTYNVVRVYDLSAFVDETYDRNEGPGSGGHLYDIGLPNGTSSWLRADKGSATRNGEGGALYNVVSCATDGTDKLLIANYFGHGNATSTSNSGFVVQYAYSRSGATFEHIVAATNGTYSEALTSNTFRNLYGKLRFRPGTRTFCVPTNSSQNGGYGYYEIDLDNPTAIVERRVQPTDNTKAINWRPYGIEFDSVGNMINTHHAPMLNGVTEETLARALQYGATYPHRDTREAREYYRVQFPMDAIKLEDVGGRDWLVVADYSRHQISLFPTPQGVNAQGEEICAVEYQETRLDGTPDEIAPTETIARVVPAGAEYSAADMQARLPLANLQNYELILLLS